MRNAFSPPNPELDLLDEYALAVGYLTMYWAALENALSFCIQMLAQVDAETAECITTQVDKAAARSTILQRLAIREGGPSVEWSDCLSGICSQIQSSFSPERNRLIHDNWHFQAGAIHRRNPALFIGKTQARKGKSLIRRTSAPSHISDIQILTRKVAHTAPTLGVLCADYNLWKKSGRIPHIPEMAIQLSKGNLPDIPPLDHESYRKPHDPPRE